MPARLPLPLLLLSFVLAPAGCMGPGSRAQCRSQKDCADAGMICSGNGFCRQECATDAECPCGSVCATTCGLCLRLGSGIPVTCFAYNRGLSREEAMGACRGAVVGPGTPEQLACLPALPVCTKYKPTPSDDAIFDAGAVDGRDAAGDVSAPADTNPDTGGRDS